MVPAVPPLMKIAGFVLLALNLALVGCASRARPTPSATLPGAETTSAPAPKIPVIKTLAGTSWIVTELGGAPAAPVAGGWAAQSLEFDRDGLRFTGHGGVNRFGGRYTEDGRKLAFGPLAMTRRAGPAGRMEAEQRYTQVLSRVSGWRQDGFDLVLIGPGEGRLAVLARATK